MEGVRPETLAHFSQKWAAIAEIQREENEKKKREQDELVQRFAAVTRQNEQPKVNTDDLQAKVVQLERELAATKSVIAGYEKQKPSLDKLVNKEKTKEDLQNEYAMLFRVHHTRANPTARAEVWYTNEKLKRFAARFGVEYGYHEESPALRAAGFPIPKDVHGKSWYEGIEVLPEPIVEPSPIGVSLPVVEGVQYGAGSPVLGGSSPGSPAASPLAGLSSSRVLGARQTRN